MATAPVDEKPTVKRDFLVDLEKKYQAEWRDAKVFEVDAPGLDEITDSSSSKVDLENEFAAQRALREKEPKWLGTFPYPYMNGSLHMGHGFTISKIEFNAGFQRLMGKRALFPCGFHCTGMPIKAASDKIIREIDMFGEDFAGYQPPAEDEPEPVAAPTPAGASATSAAAASTVGKAKKGKVAAKNTGLEYQFQIMEAADIPRAEIKKFVDPAYWLTYFPPIAKSDLTAMGARIDWRRSFVTTDANPYYDSFVRWQINKLHALDKIRFGMRYTIYSPKDAQPCMDHDRSEGEGGGPTEYTGIKMEVVQWSDAAKQALGGVINGKKVFLVAATLRPETMYGQTNCFVGATLDYGLFTAKDDEIYVCTYRAARNMAFQEIITPRDNPVKLAELKGSQIIGTKIKAPFSVNPEVYVLPMEGVLPTKGTGVVTSVPSDSPDDYATLMDLRKKAEFYKIDPSWAAFDPVPVLSTPTYGEMSAPALVKQLKIQSQKDTIKLAEAKELAYKEGFYKGTMVIGEFKGMPVEEAKPKVRDAMIAAGLAFAYAEPDRFIKSRSGDECVVALMDQWYLDYGEDVWKAQAEKLLGRMNTYSSETRHAFEAVLNWLNKWACARTYGLGSKLPWDPHFLVESLSDSTIYMSYYTVANLLHADIEGSKPGPLGIQAIQMTDEVWEYVLGSGPFPASSDIPAASLKKLRHSFTYFYPMDIRSSGKDLIPNHLTFAVYNHAALFPEEHWPLSMRANGHLMLNGKKMSKSTGNFLTLRQAIDKWGADATRLALADAGDGIEDANFDDTTANASILRLHTLIGWCQEAADGSSGFRTGEFTYHDRVFQEEFINLANETKKHYEATNYKDALKSALYETLMARDWYREVTFEEGMHQDLVLAFNRTLALLISPITPHTSEHIWKAILKQPGSVQTARWPEPPANWQPSPDLIAAGEYMRGTLKTMRDAELSLAKKKAKKGTVGAYDPSSAQKSVNIFVASKFPQWQDDSIEIMQRAYDEKTGTVDDAKIKEELASKGLLKDKRIMPFIQMQKKRMAQLGAEATFRRQLLFDEAEVLTLLTPYITKNLKLIDVTVMRVEDAKEAKVAPDMIIDTAEPGSPAFNFYNP
ncbi:Putative leucine--tRNA ligase, cytoplasmic; AltName: Full=Leucyl-tRNA synthetase; Short=LeuRS [Serendipita indica DSM 11827]|nr:Putative leucine--tRNA ligase, cytoplasmic; AltName: Full=Leucyl-tRNA synthetase; Short=LeuRS [Serendipita indica DSM 11827]